MKVEVKQSSYHTRHSFPVFRSVKSWDPLAEVRMVRWYFPDYTEFKSTCNFSTQYISINFFSELKFSRSDLNLWSRMQSASEVWPWSKSWRFGGILVLQCCCQDACDMRIHEVAPFNLQFSQQFCACFSFIGQLGIKELDTMSIPCIFPERIEK